MADRYYAESLQRTPEYAYFFAGVELERQDGMTDNSPAALEAEYAAIDEMLAELRRVDADAIAGTREWITHAYLTHALESSVAERVCRRELWNVSQMGGWHLSYTQVAQLQPVGNDQLREQSLVRWSKLAAFIDQEVRNLERRLDEGFSAPKTVVQRVIDQVDGLLALDVEDSPFYSPAAAGQ